MIECPKCQHDNDLGRIFCAKCGEKLEISRVRAPSRLRKGKGKAVPLQKTLSLLAAKIVKVVFLSFIVALVITMALPPKLEKRKFNDKNVTVFNDKRNKLEESLNAQEHARIVFNESDINAYLAKVVEKTKSKPEGANLESMYIKITSPKEVQLTVFNKWKWFHLGVQAEAQPVHKNGRWVFKLKSVRIGRLDLPRYFHDQVSDTFLKNLWSSFGQERGWIEQVVSLQMAPGEVLLVTFNPPEQ
jgi:hypothetical protein